MTSQAEMNALYDIVERAIPINGGYQCVCGREIKMKGVGDTQRGVGFMKISLIGHCKVHLKKGEYK